MSNFDSYDSPISEVQPLESFEGVAVGVVEEACPVVAPQSERTEIRIVTGTGGAVQGSQVFIDGDEIPCLTLFEARGEVGGHWKTLIGQVICDV